jgi:hypothetical protein
MLCSGRAETRAPLKAGVMPERTRVKSRVSPARREAYEELKSSIIVASALDAKKLC